MHSDAGAELPSGLTHPRVLSLVPPPQSTVHSVQVVHGSYSESTDSQHTLSRLTESASTWHRAGPQITGLVLPDRAARTVQDVVDVNEVNGVVAVAGSRPVPVPAGLSAGSPGAPLGKFCKGKGESSV